MRLKKTNFIIFLAVWHDMTVAMGRIDGSNVTIRWAKLHWRDRFNFVQASIQKIDLAQHKVTTGSGIFGFDYLVLALGSVTDNSELNRISENGKVFSLKTLNDSRLIRNHIIEVFEQATIEKRPALQQKLLTFVICGGGHIGVQLVTELSEFIERSLLNSIKWPALATPESYWWRRMKRLA